MGSGNHLAALGVSCASGAVSGGVYHAATYPITQAQTLAAPDTSMMASIRVAHSQGLGALYRGALRTSASGIAIGAMTFAVYDSVLHMLEN